MNVSKHILILMTVSAAIFTVGLGKMPLTDPDESFYAQTAKEMTEAHEWITPQIFGKPQFEKPAFYYWLIKLSYKAFGINEFSARLPSAIFGILGILGIYFLGKLIFSPLCGFLSALTMTTSVFYLVLSRACVTDVVLTVCILYTMLFFLIAWSRGKRYYYLLSAASCALAVLTKGPIGLFIPGVVFIIYLGSGYRWKKIGTIPILPSILVFAAISLPWYYMAYKAHGMGFISEFLGFQNVTRFLVPEHRIGTSHIFYLPVVIGGVFPWSFYMFAGYWLIFHRERAASRIGAHKLFLAAWFLTVFLFFSASRTKLVTYIAPLFPVLGILSGRFWEKYINSEDKTTENILLISSVLLSLLCISGTAIGAYFIKLEYPVILKPALYCMVFISLSVVLSSFFAFKKYRSASFSALIIPILLLMGPSSLFIMPDIGSLESSKVLAEQVRSLAGETELLAGESDNRRGIAFYSGRKYIVDVHPSAGSITDFLNKEERVWAIIQKKHKKQLTGTDIFFKEIAESGKFVLITNKPLDK